MNQWRYSVAMQKITPWDARHDRGGQSGWGPSGDLQGVGFRYHKNLRQSHSSPMNLIPAITHHYIAPSYSGLKKHNTLGNLTATIDHRSFHPRTERIETLPTISVIPMEEDLFTFTAYHGGEPFYTHQGVPGYNSTSKFKCLCGQSKIEVPHNMITTPTGIVWRCKLPWNICGRIYTFRLDYPDHVLHADESIKDKMDRMERSIQLVLRSLQQDPIRDALVRQEDPIAAIQRAYQQHQHPEDAMQLREDIGDAFQRLDERMWSVDESLESLNDRAEDSVRKLDRALRRVREIDEATKGNGDVLRGLQGELGAIGNLGHMIQQINPRDGFAQLQPTLFAISQSLQQLHAAVGPTAATRDAVRDIQEQLNKYNKRYDKSIGVIIG